MLMHAAMMPRTMPILWGERTTVVFKLPANVGGGAVEFNADSAVWVGVEAGFEKTGRHPERSFAVGEGGGETE